MKKRINHSVLIALGLLCISCAGGRTEKVQDVTDIPTVQKGAHQEQLERAEKLGKKPFTGPFVVKTGLDIAVEREIEEMFEGGVGIITNHTGVSKSGKHIADIFFQKSDAYKDSESSGGNSLDGFDLKAIFGPEHGVRGIEPDGESVSSTKDASTGVPIYSLYGKTRKPTREMLEGIDVLVFDIQDIGARFYTYIYTMALAMEAAAEHGVKFVILDRPNPITGSTVEGPMLVEGFESFVGMFELPVRHGMTVGELARMFKGEGWIAGAETLDLDVIQMSGWERKAWFDETDLPWTAPSPSMRTLSTATVYPGTCFIEGTNISEGRGTAYPFEQIGAPWIDGKELSREMNKLDLPGVVFEPTEFTPHAMLPSVPRPKYRDDICGGVFLRVNDRTVFKPVFTGVKLIYTIRRLYPEKFEWRGTIDRLYGSDSFRTAIDSGKTLDEILRDIGDNLTTFEEMRTKYLIYD